MGGGEFFHELRFAINVSALQMSKTECISLHKERTKDGKSRVGLQTHSKPSPSIVERLWTFGTQLHE
jgi:hypothetical protein